MRYPSYPEYKDSGMKWLGQVPAHWSAFSLKYVSTYNDETLSDHTAPDYTLEYADISSVDKTYGLTGTESLQFGKAPSRARRIVRDGDVIISTVRTYLKAIAYIKNPPSNLIVSTGFSVIRPKDKLNKKFAFYALRCSYFIESVVAHSVGISYPAINASDLVKLPIVQPTYNEQTAIANFLDRETQKIDNLVTKQQKLIELLKEKRQAVISHAVTKGINPDVKMEDSGVEWLGEVPEHWETNRSKVFFYEKDERSLTGEEELLSVSHLTGVTSRKEKNVNMFLAESMVGYKICNKGDFVINTMWAWMGAMGTPKIDGIVSPSYNVYGIRNRERINPTWIDFLSRTPEFITVATSRSKGVWSSRLRLYPESFLVHRGIV